MLSKQGYVWIGYNNLVRALLIDIQTIDSAFYVEMSSVYIYMFIVNLS